MKKQIEKAATKKQIEKALTAESKSAKIKALFDLGLEVKEIASMLEIRYNFAYNVISNYINTSEQEIKVIKKDNSTSKKQLIIEMHKQNKSNKEISIELKTNYNYVFNTIKAYKAEQAE